MVYKFDLIQNIYGVWNGLGPENWNHVQIWYVMSVITI